MKSFPSIYENSHASPFLKNDNNKSKQRTLSHVHLELSRISSNYLKRVAYIHYLQFPTSHSLLHLLLLVLGILLKQLFTKINSYFLIFKSNGYFSILIVPNHFLVFDIVNDFIPSWYCEFPCIWDTHSSDFHSSWQFCLWFFVGFSFFYILKFNRIVYCFTLSLSELFHPHVSINTYKSLTAKHLSFIHISLKSECRLPSTWL